MEAKGTKILAIAGGSASGKSLLSKFLRELLPLEHSLITIDSYYLCNKHLPMHERERVNYDHPEALEWDLFELHLHELRKGEVAKIPKYNFATHSREPEHYEVPPKEVVLVDGIFALYPKILQDFSTIKIFVDAPEKLRFERRLARDVRERGRTPESVERQWKETVEPMYQRHCLPTKQFADVHVENTGTDESCLREEAENIIELLLQKN